MLISIVVLQNVARRCWSSNSNDVMPVLETISARYEGCRRYDMLHFWGRHLIENLGRLDRQPNQSNENVLMLLIVGLAEPQQ